MASVGRLLRLWMTFEEEVPRATYLRHGAGLMALKYGVDAALVGLGSGAFWTPWDYLRSVPLLLSEDLSGAAPWLAPALALWTLPFLWIGVSMTIRRLLDAGGSAWWSLLFFVPVVSYGVMLVLSLLPRSSGPRRSASPPPVAGPLLPRALMAIGAGALLGVAALWLGVYGIATYGLSVFLGIPFVVGLFTGHLLCRRYPASPLETLEVVILTVLLVAGSAFALGIEGAVCLLMASPLGVILAGMGGLVGRRLARLSERSLGGAALIAVLLQAGMAAEAGTGSGVLREVRSSVEVDAPPSRVWDAVVAFPPLEEPREWWFRAGVAYPVRAEIEGTGPGAVRYCVFSTGAFVEPITVWEPGRRLAFDVVESPPPLAELTFREVAPPHLTGYLVPRRGEFRLIPLPEGRTRLEGSTWYEQRLRPEGYWILFSDFIIGRIHDRVLAHVARTATAGA